MEQKKQRTQSKSNDTQKSIRIGLETEKKLLKSLTAANKKKFGRKIKADQVLNLALDLLSEGHIQMLQDQSLTNEDRKERLRQSYIEEIGPISKDAFTGFMLTDEFAEFKKSKTLTLLGA